jgi:type 1 glutamine amidotransferase
MGQAVRRNVVMMIGIIILLSMAFIQSAAAAKKNILIVTGGHEFDREAFFNLFKSFGDVTFEERVHPLGDNALSISWCKPFDVLLFYDMNQTLSEQQKAAFIQTLQKGTGVIFMHHALAGYQDWPEYEKILGGKYYLKAESREGRSIPASTYRHDVDVPVTIVDPSHPITKAMTSFVIHDEVYGGYTNLSTVHVLLKTDHPESSPALAWTNTYAKSRIVYLQLGHDRQSYENPNLRKILRQAMDWVSGH